MKRMKWPAGLLLLLLAAALLPAAGCADAALTETTKGGKVVRRAWTEDGTEVNGPEGYAYVTCSYSGTSVTEKYYTADGAPFRTLAGYYGRVLTYGNKHRLTETVYLDQDGKRTACAAGYARVKIGYTAKGQETTVYYYGADNRLILVPSLGYAGIRNDYRGTTLIRRTFLDPRKKPVDIPAGYAVMSQSVNKSNQVTGIRYEHADGTPARCADGWAACERELNQDGQPVRLQYLDERGAAVQTRAGYAEERIRWESESVCVVSRFDTEGRPVPLENGAVSVRREMDGEGRIIRETWLDADGLVLKDGTGSVGRTYRYDASGAVEETAPLNE